MSAPIGVPLLTNTAVAPSCRLLALDGWLRQTARIDDPLEGVAFDAIIINPDDYAAMVNVLLLRDELL